jgi:hypothetical protein
MAVTRETYYQLFDAHVKDINKNGEAIEATHAAVANLEIQLAAERARLDGLRESRRSQFIQLKGVREIIRGLEDAERVGLRAIEDAGTE